MLQHKRFGAASCYSTAVCGSLQMSLRQVMTIGGRKSRVGQANSRSNAPQVKQGPALGVARRVPGTTKVRYTNEKGRTFSFSIPVAQLTHPPTVRESSTPGGWKYLDTSYCDTGDLEDDMPSPVQDYLNKHTVHASELGDDAVSGGLALGTDAGDEEDGLYLKLNASELAELSCLFVEFCKDYVLMDTQGMKTSLSYGELNNGPDYEMYDRKSMRKRYWLSIRHRYEDVKELLWPSSLLETRPDAAVGPCLSAEQMLQALVWLEAASTFCVRRHQPYDLAGEEEFLPLDLSREVRVLAAQVQASAGGVAFFTVRPQELQANEREAALPHPSPEAAGREVSDRFITCAALSAKYSVPFASFLCAADEVELSATAGTSGGGEVRSVLLALPELRTTRDAIRVMSVVETMTQRDVGTTRSPGSAAAATGEGSQRSSLTFSDLETGAVLDGELLAAVARLCGNPVFAPADALQNVAESELCSVLRFAVLTREHNPAFFDTRTHLDAGHEAHRLALTAFAKLAVARCQHLLYRADGPQTSVMSGDDEFIPFTEIQRNSERANPEALVHYKIGMQNAMGLRFARLRSGASATLVELLHRFDRTGSKTGVQPLISDLVQHIAQKAAMGKDNLTLDDVIRVLPLLSQLGNASGTPLRLSARAAVQAEGNDRARLFARYERLFSAISTTIGAEMQRGTITTVQMVGLLEGLAACQYVPSCFKQMEMVLLRMSLLRRGELSDMNRSLSAMARLVGTHRVSQGLMQSAATMVMETLAAESPLPSSVLGALTLARTLHHCHYPAFSSLVLTMRKSNSFPLHGETSPTASSQQNTDPSPPDALAIASAAVLLAFAAGSLPETDPQCEKLSAAGKDALCSAMNLVDKWTPGANALSLSSEIDLFIDVLTCCAALGAPVSLKETRLAERRLCAALSSPPSSGESTLLHSFCTPRLAISVLESLEALGLGGEDSALYVAGADYVGHVLAYLATVSPSGNGGVALLADDAEVARRTLYLSHITEEARSNAAAILEREVMRLDASLETPGLNAATDGRTGSFEQQALQLQEGAAQVEEAVLRYCAAIQHATTGREKVTSGDTAAA